MRLPGYGTVFRTRSEQQSPILSFGGCCVPGLAPYANTFYVRHNVCTLIDVCFMSYFGPFFFIFQYPVLFCFVFICSCFISNVWSCMFYYFFVLLWHTMFIYTSLCTLRHYLYQNVLDYKPFSSPLAKPKMIYDPFPYPFVFRQEAPFNMVIPFEGPLFLSPYSYSKIAELEFLVTKCNSCCCYQQIHVIMISLTSWLFIVQFFLIVLM